MLSFAVEGDSNMSPLKSNAGATGLNAAVVTANERNSRRSACELRAGPKPEAASHGVCAVDEAGRPAKIVTTTAPGVSASTCPYPNTPSSQCGDTTTSRRSRLMTTTQRPCSSLMTWSTRVVIPGAALDFLQRRARARSVGYRARQLALLTVTQGTCLSATSAGVNVS
jgi:hypothetical protein